MPAVEHLRHVANARGYGSVGVALESAYALAQLYQEDPPGLVPGCRQLIERHLTSAPLWWLCARMLVEDDPISAALGAVDELEGDPTDRTLARVIADEVAVLVIGSPDLVGKALRRRGDIEVLIVEGDEGHRRSLAGRLAEAGNDLSVVPGLGVASAAAAADLVLVEAVAAGPTGLLANQGSHAAAAVAARFGVPVWAVAGVGRVLPGEMWGALLNRVDAEAAEKAEEPWDRPLELVPADLVSAVVGPLGLSEGGEGLSSATCPVAAELLRATA